MFEKWAEGCLPFMRCVRELTHCLPAGTTHSALHSPGSGNTSRQSLRAYTVFTLFSRLEFRGYTPQLSVAGLSPALLRFDWGHVNNLAGGPVNKVAMATAAAAPRNLSIDVILNKKELELLAAKLKEALDSARWDHQCDHAHVQLMHASARTAVSWWRSAGDPA